MPNSEALLLDCWASPFGMRVRIALAEKKIEYEYRAENVAESKSNLLLRMNPINKKIPVLVHRGKPILESLNIVEYIDDAWQTNSPKLLPKDPYVCARAKFWADLIDKKVFESGAMIWKNNKGEGQEEGKRELIATLKLLEGALGNNKFFGGESFGFLDIALITFSPWFHVYEKFGDFKIEDECPTLTKWMNRCKGKESVSKVLASPEKLYDFVCQMRKKFGME